MLRKNEVWEVVDYGHGNFIMRRGRVSILFDSIEVDEFGTYVLLDDRGFEVAQLVAPGFKVKNLSLVKKKGKFKVKKERDVREH